MKSASYTFDRRLYEILQEEGYASVTTRQLRDAYAKRLDGMTFRIGDVRRYVYEQIRRMLRMGWLSLDKERRTRGQIYHLQTIPSHLELELIDNGFENSIKTAEGIQQKSDVRDSSIITHTPSRDADTHLEALHKEIRLDFLSSMGEAERYKLLLEELPQLRGKIEGQYRDARDRSSRMLGHLRAIEKTMMMLATAS